MLIKRLNKRCDIANVVNNVMNSDNISHGNLIRDCWPKSLEDFRNHTTVRCILFKHVEHLTLVVHTDPAKP